MAAARGVLPKLRKSGRVVYNFQRPDMGALSRMSLQERASQHRPGCRDRASAYPSCCRPLMPDTVPYARWKGVPLYPELMAKLDAIKRVCIAV
jgi:hypothetical protein